MFEKKDRILPEIDEFSAEKKASLADYQAKMAEIEATDPVFGKPEPAHQDEVGEERERMDQMDYIAAIKAFNEFKRNHKPSLFPMPGTEEAVLREAASAAIQYFDGLQEVAPGILLDENTGGKYRYIYQDGEESFEEFFEEEKDEAEAEAPDLLSSLNLGPGEERTEAMLEGFRADIRSRCPRCGLPIHPEREAEAGLCPGCGARHE